MRVKQAPGCPCGSGADYADCCGRFIESGQKAQTPEQLMRSRYTAYHLDNEAYLLTTWHPSTRPASIHIDGPAVKWTGLEILAAPPVKGEEGNVEFIARFKQNGRAGRLHENSCFVREHGEWFYKNGETGG